MSSWTRNDFNRAKLTLTQRQEIATRRIGGESARELALEYGVSATTIRKTASVYAPKDTRTEAFAWLAKQTPTFDTTTTQGDQGADDMTTTATASTTQVADLAADLTGFHPLLDQAVTALAALAEAELTADQSQTAVAALGGLEDGHFGTLLGLVVRQIASPDANPALVDLPAERKQTLRRLGAEYAAAMDDEHTQSLASEASAAIEGV